MEIETIKVKPWGQGQGEYVLINAADFDPEIHTKLDDDAPKPRVRSTRQRA